MNRRTCLLVLLAIAATVAVTACGGDHDDTEIQGRREVEHPRPLPPMAPFSDSVRFGMDSGAGGAASPHEQAPPQFQWDLPDGWSEEKPTSMRLGNFAVAADPDIDCYLSVLPGAAGGLVANVNRWRKQIGLAEQSAEEIGKLPTLPLLGDKGTLVDLAGTFTGMGGAEGKPDWRLLGVILEKQGSTVFVKMTGPAASVEAQKAKFFSLVKSLRVRPAEMTPVPGPAAAGGLKYEAPKGWTKGGEKPMRTVTFHPEGRSDTECYIVVLAGDGGGLDANLNRWRGQMGQGPLAPEELKNLPKIKVLGSEVPLLSVEGHYTGMGNTDQAGAMLLGVAVVTNGQSVFVKLTGPAEIVKKERDNFIRFCESLK